MSIHVRDLSVSSSPIVQRDHVILRLRSLVENQATMIVKLSKTQFNRTNLSEYKHNDDDTSINSYNSSSSDEEEHDRDLNQPSHSKHHYRHHHSRRRHSPTHNDYTNSNDNDNDNDNDSGNKHDDLAATVTELERRLETEQLKATRLENIRDAEVEQKLQGTRLLLNRSSLRTQRQLQANIDRLRAQVVNGQKERLELESKLSDKAREIISLNERCSEEKDKTSKLQLLTETQERSIWRMASQIEVGSPFSHLAQHATQPIVDSLKNQLTELILKLETSESERQTAHDRVNGLELNASIQKDRADRTDALYQKAQKHVETLETKLQETITKWQNKLRNTIDDLNQKHKTLITTVRTEKDAIIAAAQLVFQESEAKHEATRLLLVEEKRLGEEAMHKLSETEVKLLESDARVIDLEERLSNALATAKKEYKDVVARLDEAVSRNEAREDSFSRNWTASNFRTAVSAGDAAARTYEM